MSKGTNNISCHAPHLECSDCQYQTLVSFVPLSTKHFGSVQCSLSSIFRAEVQVVQVAVKNMLFLRWNQRAHYCFEGDPKGTLGAPKGTVPFGKGLARTLLIIFLRTIEQNVACGCHTELARFNLLIFTRGGDCLTSGQSYKSSMRFIDPNWDTNIVHKAPVRVNEIHSPILFRFESTTGLGHSYL